ncbi:YpdA family putative bacillithiol disulfide reductase [Pullulanibacillus sp. KACC 23026]|uniref:YpdA family putative bacillithiol disulfide reductase n=1 Tax=Pullulanibacillus sp. KACC 23026 TaxID=3028315 RepID=UPI0023AF3216|nr:YpdA family putative bacillithiol disulfide reductase [Pullulanibacillus sp. KACC 23026]WEG11396.1 YpdA family putative bacillithiol disulfide reductase [Pullulanibacillus sp. KACC 23026]
MENKKEQVIIVGAGPCGLSAAIECKKRGLDPLIIEKGNIVQAISNYPTHQQFFSTSQKLEIGGYPFVTEERKPKRSQALAYYREVVRRTTPRIHAFEEVKTIHATETGTFEVVTETRQGQKNVYTADHVVMATGYYDHPNYMGIPGEALPHVFHYFKEAHPYFDCDVTVIGGKNSAVDAALELNKAGARVTVLYRGSEYSESIKPWILPEFNSLVKSGEVNMIFNASIKEITEETVKFEVAGQTYDQKCDFVFAMTGYHPDHSLLKEMGINIDAETGRPFFNPETMETNVPHLFIAGVIAAGNNANEIFIENGRFHGERIAETIIKR